MVNLFTSIGSFNCNFKLAKDDGIFILGSCFADNMAAKLHDAGFKVCSNPFGTLYNPASIASSIDRLDSPAPFTHSDCVRMGAGSDLVCSFSHHTAFARSDEQEFLENVNHSLSEAASEWKKCSKVIITLGTARVWKRLDNGMTVTNCLKRPSGEFVHEMLSVDRITEMLSAIAGKHPDKEFLFTVSPIRHMGLGAHDNALSKSSLLLAIDRLGDGINYFPAFEIMMDELRDYRFYADDLIHPSKTATEMIWERFIESAIPEDIREWVRANEKAARRQAHRPMR